MIWYIDYLDEQSGENLTLLLDAFTGEPITPEPYFEATIARFNLTAANQAAMDWAADAQLGMVGQHQSELTPDGKSEIWFFYYFSTSVDSGKTFFLSNGQVVAERQADWPLPTSKALPENWMTVI